MSREDVKPPQCHARALRVLEEIELVRETMGRSADERPVPEITGAVPREVYFEALALWRKTARLAQEVGADPGGAPASPAITAIRPGHVLRVIDSALAMIAAVKTRIGVDRTATEPAIDPAKEPADVLVELIRCNRQVSRCLERPFTPEDAYRQVALASAYASAILAERRRTAAAAAFEPGRRPADCYARLEACLTAVAVLIKGAGHPALYARGTIPEVVPGDVHDLASLVVGELAFLHAITGGTTPVHAFDPPWEGRRMPAHVYQLSGTLEAQLAALVG